MPIAADPTWWDQFQHPLEEFTLLLAAATIALVVLTFFLWRAALGTLREARNISRIQLAAHLQIEQVVIVRNNQAGFWVAMTLRNFGQTPATEIEGRFSALCMKDIADPNPFPEEELGNPILLEEMPAQKLRLIETRTSTFTDAEMTHFANTHARFHLWGTVTYRDAFDKEHTLEFKRYATSSPQHATQGPIHVLPTENAVPMLVA